MWAEFVRGSGLYALGKNPSVRDVYSAFPPLRKNKHSKIQFDQVYVLD